MIECLPSGTHWLHSSSSPPPVKVNVIRPAVAIDDFVGPTLTQYCPCCRAIRCLHCPPSPLLWRYRLVETAVAAVGLEWRERHVGELCQHFLSPTEHSRSCGGAIRGTGMTMTASLLRLGCSGRWSPHQRRSYPRGQTRCLVAHICGA